jgi:hypothetical protein
MNGLGYNSWPDRMFMIPGGKPFFIEFKRPGGKLSPDQAHMHDVLRGLGYDVAVAYSFDEAIALLSVVLSVALPQVKKGTMR